MTYMKRSAQVLLIDDSETDKYIQRGFEVFRVETDDPDIPVPYAPSAELIARIEALKLDLPEDLTPEQVIEAVVKAEQENAEKSKAGAKDGKDSK